MEMEIHGDTLPSAVTPLICHHRSWSGRNCMVCVLIRHDSLKPCLTCWCTVTMWKRSVALLQSYLLLLAVNASTHLSSKSDWILICCPNKKMSVLLSHTFATAILFSAVRSGLTFFFYLCVPSVAACSQACFWCWHEDISVKRTSAFTLWPPEATPSLRWPPITMTSEQNHTILRPVTNFTWNPTSTLPSCQFLVSQRMYPDC